MSFLLVCDALVFMCIFMRLFYKAKENCFFGLCTTVILNQGIIAYKLPQKCQLKWLSSVIF